MTPANPSRHTGVPVQAARTHLPGEAGIWVFVLGDMAVFALFFMVYMAYRGEDAELYLASQQTLNVNFGAINTLLLLFSSWFVALAVQLVRDRGQRELAARFIALAAACGLSFSLIKLIEYTQKIDAGIDLMTNGFYMFYFILTGLHFVHVIVGLVLLTILWCHLRGKAAVSTLLVESTATYWHMVDLLWIVLFPLLYLVR